MRSSKVIGGQTPASALQSMGSSARQITPKQFFSPTKQPETSLKASLGLSNKNNDNMLSPQIASNDKYKHLGRVGHFVNPPKVHRSDEIIDLTFLEDDHDDDLSDHEDI